MARVSDTKGKVKESTYDKNYIQTVNSSNTNSSSNFTVTVGSTDTVKAQPRRTTGGGGKNSVEGATFNVDTGAYSYKKVNAEVRTVEIPETRNDSSTYHSAPVENTPVEKVKTDLNTFSTNLRKSAKYSKLASNLTTLYEKTMREGAEKQRQNANKSGFWGALSSGLGVIAGIVGGLATGGLGWGIALGVGSAGAGFMSSLRANDANDTSYATHANEIAQIASNVLGYSESLQSRDELIVQTMDSITSSMNDMRNTYGNAFVDQFYSLMLAKSGMTPEDYSLLTGNFRTFEAQRYGTESGEAGIWDELTESSADMFNNFYAQLTQDDIKGIQDSLNRALFAGETEVGYQLRGYENDLNTLYQNFVNSQWGTLEDARASLEKINTQNLADQINNELAVGEAQASRASSGVRGGTVMANENLARFNADLSRMAGMASATNFIRQLRNQMEQQRLTASSQAYNYRSAQRQLSIRSTNAMLEGITSVGMTAGQSENKANRDIANAMQYKENAMDKLNNLSAEETDIVLDSL